MTGTEIWADSDGTTIVNETATGTDMVMSALAEQHPEVASMIRWGAQTRRGGIFERDRFLTPTKLFDQMRVAQDAADSDDVVAGVVETTESLAFTRMSVESDDEDEQDIWNQIIENLDFDTRVREMWRELFVVSQFYVATWWGTESYKVRGRSKDGVKRKKAFTNLRVPISLSLLDPTKVIPVGNFMFNQEGLAWAADRGEAERFDSIISGGTIDQDEIVKRLIVGRYTPDREEERRLSELGVDARNLFLLDPKNVWRLTATRPQYKTFAEVRMKSIFEILDLKHLLREMDRSHLLGSTNFIVLIKKGTDQKPARNEELSALQASVRTLSRVPVIVGDHRLAIEIITPDTDMALKPERYNTLDARITARLYQMFMTGAFSAGTRGDDSLKLIKIVARGLEARRGQIRKALERRVLMEIYKRNPKLTELPSLQFHPQQVAIDFDPGLAAMFLDLRDRREISRQTILEQLDLSQDEEARRREHEDEAGLDDTFDTLTALNDPREANELALKTQKQAQQFQADQAEQNRKQAEKIAKEAPAPIVAPGVPVKAKPGPADPKAAGRTKGGNKGGGGAAPGSGQGQPPDPRRGAS